MIYIYIIILLFSVNEIQYQVIEESAFMPSIGRYIVLGWVKEIVSKQQISCADSNIEATMTIPQANFGTFSPSGIIINCWQQILDIVKIPLTKTLTNPSFEIGLNCINPAADCYFDDMKFFPYNRNLKSFVYDKDNQELIAGLDENNGASFYEYNLEGG